MGSLVQGRPASTARWRSSYCVLPSGILCSLIPSSGTYRCAMPQSGQHHAMRSSCYALPRVLSWESSKCRRVCGAQGRYWSLLCPQAMQSFLGKDTVCSAYRAQVLRCELHQIKWWNACGFCLLLCSQGEEADPEAEGELVDRKGKPIERVRKQGPWPLPTVARLLFLQQCSGLALSQPLLGPFQLVLSVAELVACCWDLQGLFSTVHTYVGPLPSLFWSLHLFSPARKHSVRRIPLTRSVVCGVAPQNALWDIVPRVREHIISSFSAEERAAFDAQFQFFDAVTSISGTLRPIPKEKRRAAIKP